MSRINAGMWFIFCLLIIIFQPLAAQEPALIEFDLKDQFDREYSHESWQGKILIVIGSDREGSQYNERWGEAIHKALADSPGFSYVQFVGVADLRGVPFFLKSFVKGKFPENRSKWLLMDWKGAFAKSYQFKGDVSNILIFAPRGERLLQKTVTQLDPAALDEIVQTVKAQMDMLVSEK